LLRSERKEKKPTVNLNMGSCHLLRWVASTLDAPQQAFWVIAPEKLEVKASIFSKSVWKTKSKGKAQAEKTLEEVGRKANPWKTRSQDQSLSSLERSRTKDQSNLPQTAWVSFQPHTLASDELYKVFQVPCPRAPSIRWS
jgi:hypothetical protein